jgi:cation transport protein ChaC
VTDVYVEAYRPVRLLDGSDRVVKALTYLVDRGHVQYAGVLSLEEQLRMVSGRRGQSGENAEYVLNTVRHLGEAGIHDPVLVALAKRLKTAAPLIPRTRHL